MSETTSPARANTFNVFARRAAIGVSAVAFAFLAPEQVNETIQTSTVTQEAPNYDIQYNIVPQMYDSVAKPLPTNTVAAEPRLTPTTPAVPKAECWDGNISDLKNVPDKNTKLAIANIAIACQMVTDESWFKKNPKKEFNCLVNIWDRESGWNSTSQNNSSGAYGIPQALPGSKMRSVASNWRTSPATQIMWGLNYIDGRYGSPCGALKHSDNHGWY